MPSRRHCRHTGPIYLAKSNLPYSSAQRFSALCDSNRRTAFFGVVRGPSKVGAVYSHTDLLPAFLNTSRRLHSSLLRRPASIVRDRRAILNGPYFEAGCRQSAYRRFTTRPRPADANFHASQTGFLGLVGRGERGLLRGERRALARSTKSKRTRA